MYFFAVATDKGSQGVWNECINQHKGFESNLNQTLNTQFSSLHTCHYSRQKIATAWMECNTEIMKIVFTEDGNAPYDVKIIYTFESDRQLKCFVKHYANKQGIPI
jgi:hypothetical protein